MGCGEKKATHLITQVQLRLRNGQAVFPQPLKVAQVVNLRARKLTACVILFYEASSHRRCRR
jgi:hypothetical protein